MSGHSHAKTVAATKNANDAKKGKIFSKMARVIIIAVKEKGADPSVNSALKAAMDKAREFNMPKDNIERAIKKGTGELAGETLESISLEAFGPGGIALIIEGITDNKNRSLSDIKTVLNKYNGKAAGEGAVRWMFERKGTIVIDPEGKAGEEVELSLIEAGAEDIRKQGDKMEVYTKPEELEKTKKALEEKKFKVESASLGWVPKEEVDTGESEKKQLQNLFDALDEQDDVQDIYSNLKS